MKIEAFNDKWKIEVTEDYVKVNGQIVAPQEQILSDMMAKDEGLGLYDQPVDCDGTPLEYGDELICVKPFTCQSGDNYTVNCEADYDPQFIIEARAYHWKEFTHSELKNFRKFK